MKALQVINKLVEDFPENEPEGQNPGVEPKVDDRHGPAAAYVNIDGYEVRIYPDPEKSGKFFSTVNFSRYMGASMPTVEKAIEKARKTVEIRKQVDGKAAARPPVDLGAGVASDFFKHKKKHNITW